MTKAEAQSLRKGDRVRNRMWPDVICTVAEDGPFRESPYSEEVFIPVYGAVHKGIGVTKAWDCFASLTSVVERQDSWADLEVGPWDGSVEDAP